jgi:hypothetical protein
MFVTVVESAAIARAQAPKRLGAVLGVSTQADGASDSPYLGPGFGGTSLAAVIFLEMDVRPNVSVGVESSLSRDITGAQSQRASGGSNSFLSQHHDSLVSGVVKLRTPATARVKLAVAGGVGIALRDTNRTGTFTSVSLQPLSQPVADSVSDIVLAFSGGLDGTFAITSRFGLLAIVRAHVLADDDRLPDGVVKRGVSSFMLRYGVGAQVRF